MPEGPEIRRAADRIAKVLVGREVVDVYFGLKRLRPFTRRLTGSVVEAIDTRGKAILTRFDNGLTLYSHNQLYGVWVTANRGRAPDSGRSLRVALHTESRSALLYSASEIEVLTGDQVEAHPFLSRIGPDVLDRRITEAEVADRLADPRFRGRSAGSLYLDQSFMAGVGNYLRSEILFTAGIHYQDRPAQLTASALRRLARTTLVVSRRSYRTRGVTLSPALASTLRGQGFSYDQYRFWVFSREGLPCYRCGTPIEGVSVASRGFYYCPVCQRRASSHPETASISGSS